MPIRFTCVHCGQKLSVSSRKAGQKGNCPKCKEKLTIPEATQEPAADEQGQDSQATDDPYAEFVVYDDPELVYEDEGTGEFEQARRVDRELVTVPRRMLYLQGMLLGAVAVVSFATGVLVGDRGAGPVASVDPSPRLVSGALTYQTGTGLESPDDGAVVIVLPADRRPGTNERAAIEGLRPGDPFPKDNHESLQTIRVFGGAYARSDQGGSYRVRLPTAGEYYFLFLSNRAERGPGEELDKRHLAQMGRYFRSVVELLGNHRYQWRKVAIRRDELIDVRFEMNS